jgi:hypothetical protein
MGSLIGRPFVLWELHMLLSKKQRTMIRQGELALVWEAIEHRERSATFLRIVKED